MHQVKILPPEKGMFLDAHLHIEMAGRAAVNAGAALARNANLHSVINAGRDGYRAGAPPSFHALRPAVGARRSDGASRAVTSRAGRSYGELPENAALRPPHLAGAGAGYAGCDWRTRFVAGARAVLARLNADNF